MKKKQPTGCQLHALNQKHLLNPWLQHGKAEEDIQHGPFPIEQLQQFKPKNCGTSATVPWNWNGGLRDEHRDRYDEPWLRPGESGLKRKLASMLSAGDDSRGPEWEVGECLGIWWRPNFESLLYPYFPPNLRRPKECVKVFLAKLPPSRRFIVPRNSRLLAVPLCQLHGKDEIYGPVISGISELLSKFSFT